MAFVRYVWTRERRETADALILQGCTAEYIAYRVGVTVHQAKIFINNSRPRLRRTHAKGPSVEAVEDRNKRMLAPRDLTSQFFGDPPKGYSALDRKMRGSQ